MTKIVETVVNVNDLSRISAGTIINGDISSPTDIRVDGHVEGKVYSKGKIVVGESAVIKGVIASNVIDNWGEIEGDVYVKDTLSVKSSAKISGNIHVRRFQVEMDAQINGSCKMISAAEYDKEIEKVITTKLAAAPEKPAK